ncbi:MAG: hypothetical protein WCI73_11235 [Phycisphaerae bacterium]
MSAIAPTLCRACNKDISTSKRIKSAQGYYYCEACCHTAAKKKSQSVPPLAAPVMMATPAATAPVAPNAASAIPFKFCPNCHAAVLPGRILCIKCHRDLTKMDKFIAIQAEGAKTSTQEIAANWIGRILKVGLILFVLGVVAFVGYGGWTLFHPPGPFDHYPTNRVQAVKDILADISAGTDKSYAHAYMLISTRVRFTSNRKDDAYKAAYTGMHNDFLKKYGPDWLAKAKITTEFPGDTGDVVPFLVTINHDEYHIDTEAQMSLASGVEQIMTHEEHPEGGKAHFGIRDIAEYSMLPKSRDQLEYEKEMREMKDQKNQKNQKNRLNQGP